MTDSNGGQADSGQQTVERIGAPFQSHLQLEPGSVILERYKVLGLLGRGGMGSVYHVRHLHLQADYALKVLDAQSNESTWRRFENEARAANRLDHPNLIRVHDSGLLPDGQPFFVMELVPGQTLADLLKKKGRLSLPQALTIFIQVGFALAYAHENGVIHRDLKPSNIMLVENSAGSLYSSVKVVDLGIAKLTGVDEFNQQTLTKTGEIFGSPLYMSPEQCMGITVDRRADLYSLGCVMYETLTGAPPIMGDNALSTMMKHQSQTPLSLKEASMGIEFPQAIEQVVANLLQKEPNARYSNAQLLTATLVNIQQSLQETSQSQSPAFTGSEILKTVYERKHNLFSLQNIVSAVVIVAAYGLGYLQGENTIDQSEASLAVKPEPKKAGIVRALEVDSSPIPLEVGDLVDGMGSKGDDPYMNTGSGYFSRQENGKRIFKFPDNKSIGSIGICQPNSDNYSHGARGTVVLPAGLIAFNSNKQLFLYPKLLKKFRPGELGALDLQKSQRSSRVLLSILPDQPNIIRLNMSGTWVEPAEIDKIGKLKKLKQLYLAGSHCDARALASMPNLLQLTNLDLTETQRASLVLKKLPANKTLYALRVKNCDLSLDDLKTISKIKTLRDLNLQDNKIVNDETLSTFLPLKTLWTLNLENCPITLRSIETLKKFPLENLQLSEANFTPQNLRLLKQALPHVKVSSSKISTEEGYQYINSSLGKL
ncbi:MAG: hypothetical protein C0469_08335 [Cyanobacteria bacterium DS2.3.42]|nr:hypothetical protein [Cyanobacteria bacterium DS2.3.42]